MLHTTTSSPWSQSLRLIGLVALTLLAACARESNPPATGGYRPGAPPGTYPQQGYPQQGYPQQPGYPGQPTSPTTPVIPPAGSLPPQPFDQLNNLDAGFMRQRCTAVYGELIGALPPAQSSLIQPVPLGFDATPGNVNAYASCSGGRAAITVTDALLEIEAQAARAKATDEVFGTRKLDAYFRFIAQNQKADQPVVRPGAGFWDPTQDIDGRKVARQHDIFDEAVAFVLGHEMAHHYLQHTGCVGASALPVTPQDIGRVLSGAVPVFNQPNEVAADSNGTTNLLNAGAKRQGYHWTEGGALLTLQFFDAVRDLSPMESLIFAFQLSHPDPNLRTPIVQQTAANWRATGGNPIVFPFPIPGFTP